MFEFFQVFQNHLYAAGRCGRNAQCIVFVIASVMMFADPSTLPGPFIAIPIGLLFWIVGAKTLKKVNGGIYAHEEKDVRKLLIGNTILFVLSCLIWGASIIIPMLTMRR